MKTTERRRQLAKIVDAEEAVSVLSHVAQEHACDCDFPAPGEDGVIRCLRCRAREALGLEPTKSAAEQRRINEE